MSIEAKVLGQQVEYPTEYSPGILVPVPRAMNREIYGIHDAYRLFTGFDAWHAYEAGFLTNNGLPVSGVLKIVYLASSPYIVESKSLKLYLNSLNMTRMGDTPGEGIDAFTNTVRVDLERILEAPVRAAFFPRDPDETPFDFPGYLVLEDDNDILRIPFNRFNEDPELLGENTLDGGEIKVCTHLLRSNCKITKQPDWGSIFIHLKASRLPSAAALLRYIVSLRNENHFHEEICEMTYKRLWDTFHPEILAVTCIYTRRGGIDICPCRTNHPRYLPTFLSSAYTLTRKLMRQ